MVVKIGSVEGGWGLRQWKPRGGECSQEASGTRRETHAIAERTTGNA